MSDEVSIPPAPSYRVPLHPRRHYDPARRTRLMIAGGLGAAVVLWFCASALLGGGSRHVPVVQAASGPERIKPTNPGGLQVAGADNTIFSGDGNATVDKLAPPPQTPDLQALRAPPPPAAPAQAAQPPQLAAAPPPAPAPPVVAAAPKAPAPAQHDQAAAAVDHRPAARADRGAYVQLAALSSEHAALAEWDALAKRMPGLLAGKQPAVSKIEHDGHTYWRLRTGGFGDTAQATMFCMRLKAKGASCSVADF